jgi:hypothetical protein
MNALFATPPLAPLGPPTFRTRARWSAGNRIVGGVTERDAMGAKDAICEDRKATIALDSDRSIPLEDDSGTILSAHQRSFIVALTKAVDDPRVANDLALARVVVRLLLRILDPAEAEGRAASLIRKRQRRGPA